MNYEKFLFIGSRGEYKGTRFEVLGHGEVDYTLKKTRYPEDAHEINKTYSTHEYYCLTNSGKIWYFAIEDEEVYYCRQLEEDEKSELSQKKILEEESGVAVLRDYKGRALGDFLNYNDFQYYDYSLGGRRYSLDIFPNGYKEWFETVFIKKEDLPEIFKDTIRLTNPKVQTTIDTINFLSKLFIASLIFILPFLVLGYIFTIVRVDEVYSNSISLDLRDTTESYELASYNTDPKTFYRTELKTELPKESLDTVLEVEIFSIKDGKTARVVDKLTLNEEKISDDFGFYTLQAQTQKIRLKVISTANPTNRTPLVVDFKLKKGGSDPSLWGLSTFIGGCLIYTLYNYKNSLQKKLVNLQYE